MEASHNAGTQISGSTQRVQTSLAKADQYSHIGQSNIACCKNVGLKFHPNPFICF